VPTIAAFYGIIIQMYWREHGPPHLHAYYQGFEALVAIENGKVIGGGPAAKCNANSQPVGLASPSRTHGQLGARSETGSISSGCRSGRIGMIDIIKVIKVEKLGGHRLRLHFSNGTEGERDFSDIIAEGGAMVDPLRDTTVFGRVFIELGTLTWPNGFDLDSIALHDEMKVAGLLRRTAA
jgi:hypothetical protein